MRIAYIVSRFPSVSETFIVRELDALSAHPDLEIELFRLFRSPPAIHAASRPWTQRLRRVGPPSAAAAICWWSIRRPLRLASSVALVIAGHARRPRVLLRALATVALGTRIARDVRRLEVDHVHAHWATYQALAAWLCGRLIGVPYSVTAHAHDLYEDRSFLARKVRDAEFIATVSEYNRTYFAELPAAAATTPLQIVRCGIELERYRFRARAPTREGPVKGICVASLNGYKGHRILLEAMHTQDAELGRLEVDLVGDGPLRGELEALVRKLGLDARVRFLGSRDEHEVAQLLDAAELFVLPSVMESLPVAAMEALAVGVPVIATRLLGVPELVRDGETGVLAAPGDPESLRRALRRVLSDPDSARERARAGRDLVEAQYDVRVSATRLAALFRAASNGPADGL